MNPSVLIDTGRSKLWIIPGYSPDYYHLIYNLPLEHRPPIVVFGKPATQNRDVGFFSDVSEGYRYSGQIMRSIPLKGHPFLAGLLPEVNKALGTSFNGILVNRYNDGKDYLGAHSDDEKALDKTKKMVAAISYGAVRKFRVRNKQTKQILLDIPMTNGMLLVMEGDFQQEFVHEIIKEMGIKDPRVSLTFRHHLE
jgi:alkylated DNA repair dioxygenase AlkB